VVQAKFGIWRIFSSKIRGSAQIETNTFEISVWITTLHWIVSWLFKPVLESMPDFADKEKMGDDM
jgi:hypothetical protein